LEEIARKTYSAVTFSVTTADDSLSKLLEPGAPVSSRRLAALRALSRSGLLGGVAMMPVLPFIEDNEVNVRRIVELAGEAGARYILPAFGMTLRDRQRAYYYDKLDQLFSGLRRRYVQAYGEQYSAHARDRAGLERVFEAARGPLGLARRMPFFAPRKRPRQPAGQPSLF
jgi:DNA repair photolyase